MRAGPVWLRLKEGLVMKIFCGCFVVLFTGSLLQQSACWAQEPSPAEEKYRAALAKASAAHAAAVTAARSEFIDALKVEMTEETKKGDLDAAIAVRDRIQRLEAAVEGNILADLAGTSWLDSLSTVYKFHADGTFSTNAGAENKKDAKLRKATMVPFTVGSDTVVIAGWNRCYDILIFDQERTEFSRYHFQFDRNTAPFSTGKLVPAAASE
jgi:hypothetical protein